MNIEQEPSKSATKTKPLWTIKVSFLVQTEDLDINGLSTAQLVHEIRDRVRNYCSASNGSVEYNNKFRFHQEKGDRTPEDWSSLDTPE